MVVLIILNSDNRNSSLRGYLRCFGSFIYHRPGVSKLFHVNWGSMFFSGRNATMDFSFVSLTPMVLYLSTPWRKQCVRCPAEEKIASWYFNAMSPCYKWWWWRELLIVIVRWVGIFGVSERRRWCLKPLPRFFYGFNKHFNGCKSSLWTLCCLCRRSTLKKLSACCFGQAVY